MSAEIATPASRLKLDTSAEHRYVSQDEEVQRKHSFPHGLPCTLLNRAQVAPQHCPKVSQRAQLAIAIAKALVINSETK